jgi:hypothetical protein
MSSTQKIKGSSWENTVAKFLSNLYGESFIRAPHSGAYVGGTNSARKSRLDESQVRAFKGDIVPGESFVRFNAECKSYADFPFHQVIHGSCKTLDQWIEQLMQTANPGDCNMLFMKFNRKGTYVAVTHGSHWNLSQSHLTYHSKNHGSWLIFEFEGFWLANKDKVKDLCS